MKTDTFFLPGRVCSSKAIREIASKASAPYTMICLKPDIEWVYLGQERMIQVMEMTGATMVYSDRFHKVQRDKGQRTKDLLLVVAGEFYNNGEQYTAQEQELGLKGKIVWHTDFIPDERVRLYFSAADLIVQPYKSATQSGVTQIAYHFERPMLVTNVGGLAEIVPDGKVGYVCPVDEAAIAEAINRFAEMSREERDALFLPNIKREKEKYAWVRMTKVICNL